MNKRNKTNGEKWRMAARLLRRKRRRKISIERIVGGGKGGEGEVVQRTLSKRSKGGDSRKGDNEEGKGERKRRNRGEREGTKIGNRCRRKLRHPHFL